MASFIEVAPINYGGGKKKMLINVEKIDYVQQEDNEGATALHLSDVPLDYFGEKDLFPKTLYVAIPFILLSDEITSTKKVK